MNFSQNLHVIFSFWLKYVGGEKEEGKQKKEEEIRWQFVTFSKSSDTAIKNDGLGCDLEQPQGNGHHGPSLCAPQWLYLVIVLAALGRMGI